MNPFKNSLPAGVRTPLQATLVTVALALASVAHAGGAEGPATASFSIKTGGHGYALHCEREAKTRPAAADNGMLSLTFQRPADIADILYQAESSVGLGGWQAAALEVINPGADPETVRASPLPVTPQPASQFLRLRFTKPITP